MSGIYEKIERTKVVNELIGTICDRCGAKIPESARFDTREFVLSFNIGESYPDDASGHVWEVEDLCDYCVFLLKELLLQNGFKVNEYDYP
jgi:hypothetical protein